MQMQPHLNFNAMYGSLSMYSNCNVSYSPSVFGGAVPLSVVPGDDLSRGKLINSDLEHGRQQSNQTLASKWMRTGAEYYTRHQDMYHRYLLKIAEALVGSLGAKKTVRGLSRCWMSYEKLENEWSFLHMLCAEPAVPGTVGALADRTAAPPAAVAHVRVCCMSDCWCWRLGGSVCCCNL